MRSILAKSVLILSLGGLFVASVLWQRVLPLEAPSLRSALFPDVNYMSSELRKESDAYRHYLIGLLHEREGNHVQAVDNFRTARELDPDSVLSNLHLGVNLVHSGNKTEAAEIFDETSRKNPDNPKVQVLTALLFASQNDYAEAIERFKLILEQNPDNLFALSSLADLYVLFNQLEEAIEIYKRIVEIKPDSSVIFFNVAIIESRLKRYEDAEQHLLKAAELKPDHVEAQVALGLIYEMQHKYDQAIVAFETALNIDPIDIRVYHNLARLYYYAGNRKSALQQYVLILKLNPKDVNAALDLAYLYIEDEDFEKAIMLVNDTLGHGVAHSKLYFMKGYALNKQVVAMSGADDVIAESARSIHREALRAFRDCLIVNPNYADAHFYLGILLHKEDDIQSARYHLERTIELAPRNAEAYNYLAYMDIQLGQNLDAAIALVKKALEIDPENAAFIDSLGWAYYKKGVYSQAIVQLEEAVRMKGGDAVIRAHLGHAYKKTGQKDKAIREWEQVLIIEPENQEVKQKLEKVKGSDR